MLGIRNFPLIINPLTPDDDWYFRAQQEWKRGNFDAVYILLTSIFHEIAHTQHGADEPVAYKEQLALFEQFARQGKLSSPYAHACRASLRERYLDVKRHPQRSAGIGQSTATNGCSARTSGGSPASIRS